MFLLKNLTNLCWVSALIAGFCVHDVAAATETRSETPPQFNIVVVGDSLSAAYNMEPGQAWPSLLQARLDQDGYDWRVFNSSITGDTTQGGLARLPRLLERHQPAIVILELGGNDGLRGLSPSVTRENLARMIRFSQEIGASVILTGIRIPPNYGEQFIRLFESIYPDLAQEYGTGLVPFFMDGVAMQPGMMQPDGIHPSVEAQPLLLDNLWPVLEPILKSSNP
jgi:acyl-CoA thioesterase-1